MPKYRLLYFNYQSLGEIARLIFAQAGVDYEDYRIRESEWPEFKSIPVLEVDGVQIADSSAVARYLAREFDELRKKYFDETAPIFLNKFESTLASSPSGFLVGDGVTWADIMFWHCLTCVEEALPVEVMSRYPKIKQHGKKVSSLPKIAEWIAKRPKTR